jgi:Histidine kinase-, DNA gyrase B-, and HSP90-like ATPase
MVGGGDAAAPEPRYNRLHMQGFVALTELDPDRRMIAQARVTQNRFYRSESARSQPGSGLGLAIVLQIADSHGGRVEAESAAGGARFRLTLVEATDTGDAKQAGAHGLPHSRVSLMGTSSMRNPRRSVSARSRPRLRSASGTCIRRPNDPSDQDPRLRRPHPAMASRRSRGRTASDTRAVRRGRPHPRNPDPLRLLPGATRRGVETRRRALVPPRRARLR